MMKTVNALSKQFFGPKYESVRKSLSAAVILFIAIHGTGFRIEIAPFILYLTSTCFTAGVMGQMLTGKRHTKALQGMFMLPFDSRSFVFSYVMVLGAYALVTKTLFIWALFLAVAAWSPWEIILAILCGCMACAVTAAGYQMCRRGSAALPILWAAGILAVILLVRQWTAVLAVAAVSLLAAVLSLIFADAYDFYCTYVSERTVQYPSRTGSVFIYLLRYLMANQSYLINTVGLCGMACFLPLLLDEFQGLNMFPIGLAVLCLDTPICTLLSCDPDLEQAVRVLPRQVSRFCIKYCLFISLINGMVAGIYLCSWQFFLGGSGLIHVGTVLLFALQSAILSVVLEWRYPIRGWKTESDLWHHPRKYFVPLIMLLLAAFVGTYEMMIWVGAAALLIECGVLLWVVRRT